MSAGRDMTRAELCAILGCDLSHDSCAPISDELHPVKHCAHGTQSLSYKSTMKAS